MKLQKQICNLLGLAMKAGKVISGEELVVKAVRSNKASLVLIANDCSANTAKNLVNKCTFYDVFHFKYGDRFVLGNAIGKEKRVVIAISDLGFALKIKNLIEIG